MKDRAFVICDVFTDRPLAAPLLQHGLIANGERVEISWEMGIERPSTRRAYAPVPQRLSGARSRIDGRARGGAEAPAVPRRSGTRRLQRRLEHEAVLVPVGPSILTHKPWSTRVAHFTWTSDQVARVEVGVSAVIVAHGTVDTAFRTR